MKALSVSQVGQWLEEHPAPVHLGQQESWAGRVTRELGQATLPELARLLADGDPELQYQAMAAARCLGAEVWAETVDPELCWSVRLPGESSPRFIRPKNQVTL